jgi:hypothetical protein
MKLSEARIGYAAYSRDFSVPGDRRRFAAYARIKDLPVKYADVGTDCDLAYITYSSDLPGWVARKRREGDRLKLVFELIDAYFARHGLFHRLLKGSARFVLGTDSRLSPDFRRTLRHACEAADLVICSTDEQREVIRRFNPNVHLSFDYFGDELGPPKASYARSGKFRIAWEGQSTTLPNLQVIRDVLNDLKGKVELHVITDPRIYRYFGRFGAYDAMDALKGIECEKIFHPWDRRTFSSRITQCDAAVIPIDRSNPLWWGKPENKLVLLWQLGMPVLTSATPVYQRVMDRAGIDMSCSATSEWSARLEALIGTAPDQAARIGAACRSYADANYSRDAFVEHFDAAFASIGMA